MLIIAIPVVLNMIEKAKKGAFLDSSLSAMRAAKDYVSMVDLGESGYTLDFVGDTAKLEVSKLNLSDNRIQGTIEITKGVNGVVSRDKSFVDNSNKYTFTALLYNGEYRICHGNVVMENVVKSNEDCDGIAINDNEEEETENPFGIKQITSGGDNVTLHTMVLLNNGTVWGWGSNGSGQLGDGTTTNKTYPVQVKKSATEGDYLTNVVKISTNLEHTLVLLSDGTVWGWGSNEHGRLGDGTTTTRTYPIQAKKSATEGDYLTNVVDIFAGRNSSIALLSDGTVRTWGYNATGQLGDGTRVNKSYPVQVKKDATMPLTNAIEISSEGSGHTIALLSDGTVWGWGANSYGQLGDGGITYKTYATQVKKSSTAGDYLTNVVEVSAGHVHTTALLSDGTVWTWGNGTNGELGNGITTRRSYAVQVKKSAVAEDYLTNVSHIVTGGGQYSIVLLKDGTIWSWGHNSLGQLGDGTKTNRNYPVQVKKSAVAEDYLTNVNKISGSLYKVTVLLNDGTLWTWGMNVLYPTQVIKDENTPF